MTNSMLSPPIVNASSTFALRATVRPPRIPSSCVMIALQVESSTRSTIERGLNPPKMTECTAPMRAQASIATTSSGTIPM